MVFIFWIKRKTKIKWLLRHAVICAHSGLIWFWISRRMEPLWTTSSRVKLLAQLKTGFLCLRGMSPLCLSPLPLFLSSFSMRKVCLHLVQAFPSDIYVDWQYPPELLYAEVSWLCQLLLLWQMLKALNHLYGPLLDLLQCFWLFIF